MNWDASAFREQLAERVNRFDKPGAAALCDKLIAHLARRDEADPYPAGDAKEILQLLRRNRMFTLMQNVAEALVYKVDDSLQIRRQYVQSLIDQGNIPDALDELDSLIADSGADRDENAEARGLKGRAYKQLYVDAKNPASRLSRKNLELAVRAYLEVYETDTDNYLWHGINVVALLCRARRDGVTLEGYPDPLELAQTILRRVEKKEEDRKARYWDFATAAEACIALGQPADAVEWIVKYIQHGDSYAFELSSTLRQLTNVWGLDVKSEAGGRILPILRTELLSREGGEVEFSADDLIPQARSRSAPRATFEKVFGADSYKTYDWYMMGANRCRVIARIGREAAQGFGTGFLIKGSDLNKAWGDSPVLLTNSHVVSDDPTVEDALRSDDAVITFQLLGPEEYRVEEILWSSPPTELDATIIKLNKPVPSAEFYPIAKKLPLVEDSQRVYIIGHPKGGTLSLSLQDNILLDHQDPRIHYRTPTEGGSSGSPVFNRQWTLLGLHHAGDEKMPRLNNKAGTYEANEGIWIGAIISAIAKEHS